jgi:hypothetical protein
VSTSTPLSTPSSASALRIRTALVGLLTLVATFAALLYGSLSASASSATPAAHAAPAAARAKMTARPPLRDFTKPALSDSFNRLVRHGWGAIAPGRHYRTFGSTGHVMTLAGNGYVLDVASGNGREQRVVGVRTANLLYTTRFSIAHVARRGSWSAYVGLEFRRQTNGEAYTSVIHVTKGGEASLNVSRRNADGTGVLLNSRSLHRVRAGRAYHMQVAMIGSQIWARVWRAGQRLPHWTPATDSSAGAITRAGGVGAMVYTGGVHASTSVRFQSLKVTELGRSVDGGGSTTPPTTTPPTTTPPTTTPPTTTPPTTSNPPATDAGSAPLGSTDYSYPSNALFVATTGSDSTGTGTISNPFATVSGALRVATNGATVVVRGGSYNTDTFVKNGSSVTIQNYPGETVWFDGSTPVTTWTQQGNDWVHSGYTQNFDDSASFTTGSNDGGFLLDAYPLAAWPDQVFFGDKQLQQVAANPAAGEFAVDKQSQQLIVGSDPTGYAVRASNKTQAFVIGGTITLRGIGVRRYATSNPMIGTVYVGDSAGPSTFENDIIDNNATTGLATNNAADTFNHLTLSNNGMTGMGVGHADGTIVENCLWTGNNTQHFHPDPASAGIKVGRTNGITIRNNVAKNNINEAGIWTDENVTNFTITGNTVIGNGTSYGIENELSGTGIVANNTISGSAYGYTAVDSGNIKIFNNDVDGNTVWDIGGSQDARYEPGHGTAGPSVQPSAANPWLVQNLMVANNNFGRSNGGFGFYVLDKETGRPASSMNITVQGNLFGAKDSSAKPNAFGWGQAAEKLNMYASPAAFNAGEGYNWVNMVAPSGTGYMASTSMDSSAVPLPADVASAVGEPTGAQNIGTF